MTKPSLLKVAGRSLFFYAIDMAIAMCGFIFGFGLEVKSWPALICFLILSRWVTHVILMAFMRSDITAGVKMEDDGGSRADTCDYLLLTH